MATERPNKNPYSAFNFIVEINGAQIAGFQEISGLDSENTPIEYREGSDKLNNVRNMVGMEKHPRLTCKTRHHRQPGAVELAQGGARRQHCLPARPRRHDPAAKREARERRTSGSSSTPGAASSRVRR